MSQILDGVEIDSLLQGIPSNVRSSLEALERAGTDWNAVGNLLAATPTAGVALTGTGQWTADLWEAVKWEFRIFLCTDSDVYRELRNEWGDLTQKSPALAVGSLSTAMGAKLGVASGVLAPLVTWLFVVAVRLGEEGVCVTLSAGPGAGSVQSWSSHA
jgi:hypothetical protein